MNRPVSELSGEFPHSVHIFTSNSCTKSSTERCGCLSCWIFPKTKSSVCNISRPVNNQLGVYSVLRIPVCAHHKKKMRMPVALVLRDRLGEERIQCAMQSLDHFVRTWQMSSVYES